MRRTLAVIFLLLAACNRPPAEIELPYRGDEGERRAAFYLSLLAPDRAGSLLRRDGERVLLRAEPVRQLAPELAALLDSASAGTPPRLNGHGWHTFARPLVAASVHFPATLDGLYPEGLPHNRPQAYFSFSLYGSMAPVARRLYVPLAALHRGLLDYFAAGERLRYPPGTVITGYHLSEAGQVLEYTVKRRRADGYWDFAVYDRDGKLSDRMLTSDEPVQAPFQCVGCHISDRQFEPEKSFPGKASRFADEEILLPPALADSAIARYLDEHRKRADNVLGLYGTIYLAHLRQLAAGERSPEQAAIYRQFAARLGW